MSAPILPDTSGAGVDPGFEPGPPVVTLCGFKLPTLKWKFGFRIPGLGIPIPPPLPVLALGIVCDLNNPLNVTAGLPNGGGRKPNLTPDPDTIGK